MYNNSKHANARHYLLAMERQVQAKRRSPKRCNINWSLYTFMFLLTHSQVCFLKVNCRIKNFVPLPLLNSSRGLIIRHALRKTRCQACRPMKAATVVRSAVHSAAARFEYSIALAKRFRVPVVGATRFCGSGSRPAKHHPARAMVLRAKRCRRVAMSRRVRARCRVNAECSSKHLAFVVIRCKSANRCKVAFQP